MAQVAPPERVAFVSLCLCVSRVFCGVCVWYGGGKKCSGCSVCWMCVRLCVWVGVQGELNMTRNLVWTKRMSVCAVCRGVCVLVCGVMWRGYDACTVV